MIGWVFPGLVFVSALGDKSAMRRRAFLTGLGALVERASPREAWAQAAPHRIGYVFSGSRGAKVSREGLKQGFADSGYAFRLAPPITRLAAADVVIE